MIKKYGFLVYSCSYHKLGDLSTSLEMTVLGRVFLQGKTTFPGDKPVPGVSSGIICPLNDMLRYALNDRTTLEMMFFGDRHFDQVKRVEKSPKAKQDSIAC